jgi:hypothetical protein
MAWHGAHTYMIAARIRVNLAKVKMAIFFPREMAKYFLMELQMAKFYFRLTYEL